MTLIHCGPTLPLGIMNLIKLESTLPVDASTKL